MSLALTWLSGDPASPFPPHQLALKRPNGLLAAGGDLSVARLCHAYRFGVFPWFSAGEPVLWWSPDPRCVFEPAHTRPDTRLARFFRQQRWRVDADRDFAAVIDACAAPRAVDQGTWIVASMRDAYVALHAAGHAHCVEVRDESDDLIGGLYGVAIGELFFAESMFSRCSNASKAALFALALRLREWRWPLIDAQVASDHLLRLGAITLPRERFLAVLAGATPLPGLPGARFREAFGALAAADLGQLPLATI